MIVMGKKHLKLVLPTMLMAGLMFSSCVRDTHGGKIDPDGKGDRCLAMNISIDGLTATRAGDESTGIENESRIGSMRFIFYNTDGIAEYVDSYRIFHNDNGWNIEPDVIDYSQPSTNIGTLTYTGVGNPISAVFSGLKNKPYKLLVIANNASGDYNLKAIAPDYSGTTDSYNTVSSKIGHNVNLFSNPVNFVSALYWENDPVPSDNYEMMSSYYSYGAWPALIGGTYPFEGSGIGSKEDFDNFLDYSQYMLMMNADGLVDVTEENMSASIDGAKAKAVTVNIERTMAKVALFDQLPPALKNGGTVSGDINWALDIMNIKTYFLRQKAPLGGGRGAELPGSSRKYRYALDPNYTGVSAERPNGSGSTALVARNFVRFDTGNYPQMMFRKANPKSESPSDDAHKWSYWDYVTENTMEAREQYEDVTTRMLVQLNYVPGTTQQVGSSSGISAQIQGGDSYYSYKNKLAFTLADMNAIANATDIEAEIDAVKETIAGTNADEIKGLLEELKEVLADTDTRNIFGNFLPSATTAVSYNGLHRHLDGMCYYYVLVRHFDDTIESTPMAYGRYGVVRNNVYKVVLKDINGPGSAVIPDPEGPDDKDKPLVANIYVADWITRPLDFDL